MAGMGEKFVRRFLKGANDSAPKHHAYMAADVPAKSSGVLGEGEMPTDKFSGGGATNQNHKGQYAHLYGQSVKSPAELALQPLSALPWRLGSPPPNAQELTKQLWGLLKAGDYDEAARWSKNNFGQPWSEVATDVMPFLEQMFTNFQDLPWSPKP